LHDNIATLRILSLFFFFFGINDVEQFNDLSLADIVNNHLDLIVARLDKELLQLRQIVLEDVAEKAHS
jgi:hypothetical protein